jgi:hypothetical protein
MGRLAGRQINLKELIKISGNITAAILEAPYF